MRKNEIAREYTLYGMKENGK